MNGTLKAMLLFRHDGLQQRGGQSQANAYHAESDAPRGLQRGLEKTGLKARLATGDALDQDEIDGTARPVIVKHPNRQPPGLPGGGVEVGAALV